MDTEIKPKPPKPKVRYHYKKGYWTCKGPGGSTAAGTPERAYEAWLISRARRVERATQYRRERMASLLANRMRPCKSTT